MVSQPKLSLFLLTQKHVHVHELQVAIFYTFYYRRMIVLENNTVKVRRVCLVRVLKLKVMPHARFFHKKKTISSGLTIES